MIFAEGCEGSSITNGTKNVRNERSGRMERQEVSMDACPSCTSGETVAPRLALLSTPAPIDATGVQERYDRYRASRTPAAPARPLVDQEALARYVDEQQAARPTRPAEEHHTRTDLNPVEDDEDPRAWTDTIPHPGF